MVKKRFCHGTKKAATPWRSSRFVMAAACGVAALTCLSCREKPKTEVTPWGTTISTGTEDADTMMLPYSDHYSLRDIQQAGELIMLTMYGPNTYYEYHGRGMGVHYLLAEKLAEHLGVTLRVDVCKDTLDMLERLRNGEGDIIALPVGKEKQKGFIACGVETVPKTNAKKKSGSGGSWLVSEKSTELAQAVNAWYKPELFAETEKQQHYMLTSGSVTRHVYPFMLSAKEGTISQYDALFRKHAPVAGMDWSLLAAQCYQESCFDPRAHSWAGACGLMQIMPSTADHLQLPRAQMYEPEPNIEAAARYMRELQAHFSDVGNPQERMKFALAAYNGGALHIRDAMELTKKHGGVWQRWDDVKHYVLALAEPEYYQDPVVKNGYMRGSETADYVDKIMNRWQQYRHALHTGGKVVSSVKKSGTAVQHKPSTDNTADAHRAAKKNKWRKD